MPYFDFHIHSDSSHDGQASVSAICDAAAEAGLTHIAVTDHVEMVDFNRYGCEAAAARSAMEVAAAQKQLPAGLRLFFGVELGCPLFDLPKTDALLNTYDYDFVLASQHQLGADPDFYYLDFAQLDIGKTLDRYFEAVLALCEWGRFHALAHLTYPMRYISLELRPDGYGRWQKVIDEILRVMARDGLALEVNTGGLRKPVRLTSPDLPLIRRFYELGGEYVTIGSDAHRLCELGSGLQEGLRLIREAGFDRITYFEKGRAVSVPLESVFKPASRPLYE